MAQFDIYENEDINTKSIKPFFLDVQSSLLNSLSTRVVIPLIPKKLVKQPVDTLNPVFRVQNQNLCLSSSELCGLHKNTLGKKIGNLSKHSATIQAALDLLLAD